MKYLKDIVKRSVIEARRHCCQVVVCVVALLHFAARRLRIAHQRAVHVCADLLKVTACVFQPTNITASQQLRNTHDNYVTDTLTANSNG